MNNKLIRYTKMFYDSKWLIQARYLNWLMITTLFIISVIMASIPLYMGRISLNAEDIKSKLPGIEEALQVLYESEPKIKINAQGELVLDQQPTITKAGNYHIYFNQTSEEKTNAIIFFKKGMIIQYGTNPNNQFRIAGSYLFLKGIDFSKVKSEVGISTSNNDYTTLTNSILHGIHYGNLFIDYFQITFFNAIQILFYSSVITFLLKIGLNKRVSLYRDLFKMVIVAAFGPAFIVALVSFINIQVASLLFPVIFTSKIIVLYFKYIRNSLFEPSLKTS